MVPLDEVLARQKEMTTQLSAQTRTVALGFLAFAWTLLTAHDEPLRTMAANAGQSLLIGLCAFSVGVLLCDSFQYFFGAQSAAQTILRAEESKNQEALYDSRSFSYRMQWGMYNLKLGLLILGFGLMVVTFVRLFRTPPKTTTPSAQTAAPPSLPPGGPPSAPATH